MHYPSGNSYQPEREIAQVRIPRFLRKLSALGVFFCAYPIFMFWVELIEATRVFGPFSNWYGISGLLLGTIVVIGLSASFFASSDRTLHYPLFIAVAACVGATSYRLIRILDGSQRDIGRASFLNPSDSWPWIVAALLGSLAVLVSAVIARALQLRTS